MRGGSRRQKGRRGVDRRDIAPTWRSAVNRALIGAGIFLLLLLVPFHQKPVAAIPLAVVMMAVYIPLGYGIEKFFYNRRQAQKAKAAAAAKQR
jgi:ABC-type multidrug transport system permease subunit